MLVSDDELVQHIAQQTIESAREMLSMFSPEVWEFLEAHRLRKIGNGASETLPVSLSGGNGVEDNSVDSLEGQDAAVQS